jgi:hypothetical protein
VFFNPPKLVPLVPPVGQDTFA